MRESVFSSLGPLVEDARVLDLFAGSGAYGFEAWSRGASDLLAIERDRQAVAAWRENRRAVARSLGADATRARVQASDVLRWSSAGWFDLIFADPPYPEMNRVFPCLGEIARSCLAPGEGARLVVEMPGEFEPRLPGFSVMKRIGKGRGQPSVAIFARPLS